MRTAPPAADAPQPEFSAGDPVAEHPAIEAPAPTEILSAIVSEIQASPAEVPLVERLEESVSAETMMAAESSLEAASPLEAESLTETESPPQAVSSVEAESFSESETFPETAPSLGSDGEDHGQGSVPAAEEPPPALDAVETAASAIPEPTPAPNTVAAEAETVGEPIAREIEAVTEAAVEPFLQAVEATAEAEPAHVASDTASVPAEAAKQAQHSFQIGANFIFRPPLAPFSEINAKLFAFARGESEAALAHFQALTRAKSPAEAIRLQVTELQRAADASLTCFSEIVRSANRLSDIARWH